MRTEEEFLRDLTKHVGFETTYEEGLRHVILRAKHEVIEDMDAGYVPKTVGSYSDLHDHVDANYYGGVFEWPGPLPSDQDGVYADLFWKFWNGVQDAVDDWIKKGGFREWPT